MTPPLLPETPRRRLPRLLGDYRFWLVVAMVALGTILHLGGETGLLIPIPVLSSHDLHRLFYLVPIIYAAYHFGAQIGFALAVYTALVFAPHALWEVQTGEWEYAVLELAGTAGVGGLVGWLVAAQVGQRRRVERALAELSQSEQELRSHLQIVETDQRWHVALYTIAEACSQAQDVSTLLNRALDALLEVLRLDQRGGIFLVDEERDELHLAAHRGLSREFAAAEARVPLGECLCGLAAQSGEIILSPDSSTDRRHSRMAMAEPHSHIIVPFKAAGRVAGVAFFYPEANYQCSPTDIQLLIAASTQVGLAIERIGLLEKERSERQRAEALALAATQARQQLEDAYLEITRALIATLETKDYYTGGHSQRVRQFARQIAVEMELPHEEVETISLAAELHDLGKIGIPDRILLKPGPLEPAEWAEIKRHPGRSVDILRHLGFLGQALPIIRAHHERYDGQGYPDNLANGNIPLGARILAAADAYDALTSDRPYRPAFSHEQALAILQENAGSQWDLQVVAAFSASLEKTGPPPRSES